MATPPVDTPTNRPARDINRPKERLDVVPDHDPLVVRGEFIGRDADLLASARAPLASARALRVAVNELIDGTDNKAELARAASARMHAVTKQFDASHAALVRQRDSLERDIATVLSGQPDSHAAAICHHWASRDSRFPDLIKLCGDGDLRTVAAVLAAPSYLSGLTADQHRQLRDQARVKFAPAQTGLSQDLGRAINLTETVGARLVKDVGGLIHAWGRADRDAARINKVIGSGS